MEILQMTDNNRKSIFQLLNKEGYSCLGTLGVIFLILIVMAIVIPNISKYRVHNSISISESKLEAEEAGYFETLKNEYDTVKRLSNEICDCAERVRRYSSEGNHERARTAQKDMDEALHQLSQFSRKSVNRIKLILPPSSLSNTQDELLRLLSIAQVTRKTTSFVNDCNRFLNHITKLETSINAREPKKFHSTISVVFSPTIIPIGFQFVGGFSVELGIPTPFGTLAFKSDNQTGVTTLTIRHNKFERYFRLDRPFKVYVPTEYGIEVSVLEPGRLVIDVLNRSANMKGA